MTQSAAPPAPADDPRSDLELEAVLARRTSAMAALGKGARLASLSAPIGLPTALLFGLVSGAGGQLFMAFSDVLQKSARPTVELWAQGAYVLAGFLNLYAIVQFGKRDRVSRTSWWPALFALPALLVAIACSLELSGTARQVPIVPTFLLFSWWLSFLSIGGAAAAIAWLRAGQAAMSGERADAGAIVSEIRRRTIEVSAPHGAKVHAVTVGMQIILPGVFYTLQLAFTDMIAVLDPTRPALRRSGQLTFGMRGRLFRMYVVWWFVTPVLAMVAAGAYEGVLEPLALAQKWGELMFDPSAISPVAGVISEVVWWLTSWVLTMALLVLYVEREEQVRARTVLKGRGAKAP